MRRATPSIGYKNLKEQSMSQSGAILSAPFTENRQSRFLTIKLTASSAAKVNPF